MTPDEFAANYHPLKELVSGPVHSVLATRKRTQAVVMLHYFMGDANHPNRQLIPLLETLPDDKKSRIVEHFEVNGAPVVITKVLFDFTGLDAWLGVPLPGTTTLAGVPAVHLEAPHEAPQVASPPAAPQPRPPAVDTEVSTLIMERQPRPITPLATPRSAGEFSAMSTGAFMPSPAPAIIPPAAAAPREPIVPPAPAAKTPGEFTAMFSAHARPVETPPAASPPAAAPLPPPPAAAKPPGEFTAMFAKVQRPAQSPASLEATPPQPSPPASPAPSPVQASIFTPAPFASPVVPEPVAPTPPSVTPIAPPAPTPLFTPAPFAAQHAPPVEPPATPPAATFVGVPAAPPPPPPTAAAPPSLATTLPPTRRATVAGDSASASMVFTPPSVPTTPAPPPAAAKPPAAPTKPGDFTQIFAPVPKPAAQPTLPPAAAPPGMFTQMLSSSSPSIPKAPEPPAPKPKAGLFTQMISDSGQTMPAPAAPAPSPADDFARMFPTSPTPPVEDDLSARLNRARNTPNEGTVGATGVSMPAQRAPLPPPSAEPVDEFAKMFGSGPAGGTPGPMSGAGASRPPAPGMPAPKGGSEFTRALQRVELSDLTPKPVSAAPPAAPTPAIPKKAPPIVLIVVGVAGLITIALILFVSLRGR